MYIITALPHFRSEVKKDPMKECKKLEVKLKFIISKNR